MPLKGLEKMWIPFFFLQRRQETLHARAGVGRAVNDRVVPQGVGRQVNRMIRAKDDLLAG